MRIVKTSFLLALTGLAAYVAAEMPPTPPQANSSLAAPSAILGGRPDADAVSPADPDATNLLGSTFKSIAVGLEFRAPVNAVETKQAGGEEIVQYSNEAKRWVLKVNHLTFNEPIAMAYHQVDGHDVNGLLEETVEQLKTNSQGIDIKRQEVVRTGQLDIGMIAGRYNIGTEGNLALVALVRQTPLDGNVDAARVYYSFNLTAVVDKKIVDVEKDPAAQYAVKMFQQVLDSIRLLDQSQLREDQEDRLFRTRSLFVVLNQSKLRSTLAREQWLRLIRDGKDIGYTYVVEETGRDLPRSGRKTQQGGVGADDEGVLIGVRSRTLPESGVQVDAESWMWCSFDRRHEKWSNVAVINNPRTGKEAVGDLGSSDAAMRIVDDVEKGETYKDRNGRPRTDKEQPAVRQVESMMLNVTHIGREKNHEPITRQLPPFYIPQAISHLLPRLVRDHLGSTYMFATYNSDTREVMMRYVDVGHLTTVDLAGQSVTAVPVKDRLGLEGSVTTHYVSPQGKYLGSMNPDSKILILASDATTISKLWKDADLSRPRDIDAIPETK